MAVRTTVPQLPWKFYVPVTRGQVTRSGQVTPSPKNFPIASQCSARTVVERFETFRIRYRYYHVHTTCVSRIFLYRWPNVIRRALKLKSSSSDLRSGQFRNLHIISQSGKTQMPQILIRSVQIAQNHAQLGYCWWPWCKVAYVTPVKVSWGQIMAWWGQCTFLLKTFDWIEI